MADFVPQTSIYLFKDTRVDAENQPYFTNEAAKISWYMSHPTKAYDEQSYQRMERGYLRVDGKADDLMAYDMLGFKNGDGKWRICRILSAEFINPNCVEIRFEPDYMQTYIEQTQFRHCWVEREMAENDWSGGSPSFDNWQPEGLETGPLIRTLHPRSLDLSIFFHEVAVLSALDRDAEPLISPFYHSDPFYYPSIVNVIKFDTTSLGMSELGTMLSKYVDKGRQDAIAAIYLSSDTEPLRIVDVDIDWNSINGYKPINAKCWSSEFCHFIIGNRQGAESVLMPEAYKGKSTMRLRMQSVFADGSGGSLLYPDSYYGDTRGSGVYIPWNIQLAWTTSGWYNWLAQNMGSLTAEVTDEALTRGFFSFVSGGTFVEGAGVSLIGSATKAAGKTIDSYLNPEYRASAGNGSLFNSATSNIGFNVELATPSAAAIESIDQFFSRFGYRTNRLKVPNVNTRPLWNYVKTAGAVVSGPFDHTAKVEMQKMLDNGVTFWHVPAATIGDYSDLEGNKS